MNDVFIDQLIKENIAMQAAITDLREALRAEVRDTTDHIKLIHKKLKMIDQFAAKIDKRADRNHKFLCQHIADLHDIVTPIENKIFPGARKARKQLASLLGPKRLGAGEKLDRKKP